jgi:hypothetical protein
VVHIIGMDPNDPVGLKNYLGDRDVSSLKGSGAVDHVAFFATGLAGMLAHLRSLGIDPRERTVPSLGLHQIFLDDPNGVVIELNYPASEKAALPGLTRWPAIVVAGGSLGGLMAANLLARAGHAVTVLEKAPAPGRPRRRHRHPFGAGGGPAPLRHAGRHARWVSPGARPRHAGQQGGVLGTLAMPQVLTSWSRLYPSCATCCPPRGVPAGRGGAGRARGGRRRGAGHQRGRPALRAAGGRRRHPLGAAPAAVARRAARIRRLRGLARLCDEAVLSRGARDAVFERFGFCLPPGEQLIGYPVAGPGNRTEPGHRAWNFVWYRPRPRRSGCRNC